MNIRQKIANKELTMHEVYQVLAKLQSRFKEPQALAYYLIEQELKRINYDEEKVNTERIFELEMINTWSDVASLIFKYM